MRSDQDGVYVPRRVIFIMIIVFLGINIFCLLMGIVIGKDDLKWREQGATDTGFAQTVEDDNLTRDALENELSVFENDTEDERDKPIDVSYLDSGFEEPEEEAPKPSRTTSTQAPAPPAATESQPARTTRNQTSSPPPAAASGRFWVQIVASSERAKADEIRGQAQSGGFPGVVVTQGGYHKVHLGPYSTREEAGGQVAKIKKELGYDGWIVTR